MASKDLIQERPRLNYIDEVTSNVRFAGEESGRGERGAGVSAQSIMGYLWYQVVSGLLSM